MLLVNPLFAASSQQDAALLKGKLTSLKQVNANFSQVVTNSEGEILNESHGTLTILRPGKFRWEVLEPEEELITSDGETMWLYSPFIEQVTLMKLSDAVAGTPFVLLSGASDEQWQKYQVKKEGNRFTIKSINEKEQHQSFIFEFDKKGSIHSFIVNEEQGQHSEFKLIDKPQIKNISADYFAFKIPDGVEIDDQR